MNNLAHKTPFLPSRPISSDRGWNILQICFSPEPKIHPAISRNVTGDKRHIHTHTDLFTHFWFSIPRHNESSYLYFCTCNLYFCTPAQQCLNPGCGAHTLLIPFYSSDTAVENIKKHPFKLEFFLHKFKR